MPRNTKVQSVEVPVYLSLRDDDFENLLTQKKVAEGYTKVFHSLRYPAFTVSIPEPPKDKNK